MVTVASLSRSRWARARWLVLAPHADDETLGAGALIAEAAAGGRLAGVAYLTDGTGSHPGVPGLAGVRRAEAGLALRRLTGFTPDIAWIGWRDAHPYAPDSRPFDLSRDRLGALLRVWRVDAIAVTAAIEPHCDHAAAHQLASAAIGVSRRKVALFEYHVWSRPPAPARAIRTASMPAGRRRRALRAHRSQLTSSMGEGFRLPSDHQRMPPFDLLYLTGSRR